MNVDQSTSALTIQTLDESETSQTQECTMEPTTSTEICTNTADIKSVEQDILSSTLESPANFDLGFSLSENLVTTAVNTEVLERTSIPLVIVSGPPSLAMESRKCLQPSMNLDLPSLAPVVPEHPQTHLQAQEYEMESTTSTEICTNTVDLKSMQQHIVPSTLESPATLELGSWLSENLVTTSANTEVLERTSMPLVIVSRPPSLGIESRKCLQPFMYLDLPSLAPVVTEQPQTHLQDQDTVDIKSVEQDIVSSTLESPATFELGSSLSENLVTTAVNTEVLERTSMPLVIVSKPLSLGIESRKCLQPLMNLDLPSLAPVVTEQPQTHLQDQDTVDIKSVEQDIVSSTLESPATFELGSSLSENLVTTAVNTEVLERTSMPLVIVSRPQSLVMQSRKSLKPFMNSDLPSPASMIRGQPQTLFLQALSKLNESSLSMAVMNHFTAQPNTSARAYWRKVAELSPPDSLASAPPSYSFVLRQMATRRRPGIVGTFIPSPSFIQHTPPPHYTAEFDIFLENSIPPPPTRVYNFGFTSMPVVCPMCGYTGMSLVSSKITLCTHLCAIVLCVMCCWVCAPLPYFIRSCKDVYHHCRNCRYLLGMYCPTNTESGLPT